MVFALLNGTKWAVHFSSAPYHPIDFRTYYLGAKGFLVQMNPYSDQVQKMLWEQEEKKEKTTWQKNTGFPHAVVVYAPQFVWFFSIYNAFDFTYSKWVQLAINFCSVFLMVYIIKRLHPALNTLMVAASVLAFRGTWYALDTGQPMLQVLALCLLAFYLIEKKNLSFVPAVLLALVSFKFTLLAPVVFYLVWTRNFRTISLYVSMVLILNTLALICMPYPADAIIAWRSNIDALWDYTHAYHSINGLTVISTSVFVPLAYFSEAGLKAVSLACIGAAYIGSYVIGKKISARAGMAAVCLAGLCFGHHLIYDILALICFLWIWNEKDSTDNYVFFALALTLLLPLGVIADQSGQPLIHFFLPFLLFLYALYLAVFYFPSKYKAIKNPS